MKPKQAPKRRKTATRKKAVHKTAALKAAKPDQIQAEPTKLGRPEKLEITDLTLHQIEQLGMRHATIKEGAAWFNVNRDTFSDFLRKYKKAEDAWERGRGKFCLKIRDKQREKAEAGNTTMLIWLGKQYLDQRDKIEENVNAKHEHEFVADAAADFDRRIASVFARTTARGISSTTH